MNVDNAHAFATQVAEAVGIAGTTRAFAARADTAVARHFTAAVVEAPSRLGSRWIVDPAEVRANARTLSQLTEPVRRGQQLLAAGVAQLEPNLSPEQRTAMGLAIAQTVGGTKGVTQNAVAMRDLVALADRVEAVGLAGRPIKRRELDRALAPHGPSAGARLRNENEVQTLWPTQLAPQLDHVAAQLERLVRDRVEQWAALDEFERQLAAVSEALNRPDLAHVARRHATDALASAARDAELLAGTGDHVPGADAALLQLGAGWTA